MDPYQVQARIGDRPWTNLYTGTATSIVKFYPFKQAARLPGPREGQRRATGPRWVNSGARKIVAVQNLTTTDIVPRPVARRANRASSGGGYAVTTTRVTASAS